MRNPAEAAPAVTMHVPTQAVLHLRGATMQQEAEQEVERRSITWAEDVVDNEGMGKKSSKGLCSASPHSKFRTALSEYG